jgi:hypothetical protein
MPDVDACVVEDVLDAVVCEPLDEVPEPPFPKL